MIFSFQKKSLILLLSITDRDNLVLKAELEIIDIFMTSLLDLRVSLFSETASDLSVFQKTIHDVFLKTQAPVKKQQIIMSVTQFWKKSQYHQILVLQQLQKYGILEGHDFIDFFFSKFFNFETKEEEKNQIVKEKDINFLASWIWEELFVHSLEKVISLAKTAFLESKREKKEKEMEEKVENEAKEAKEKAESKEIKIEGEIKSEEKIIKEEKTESILGNKFAPNIIKKNRSKYDMMFPSHKEHIIQFFLAIFDHLALTLEKEQRDWMLDLIFERFFSFFRRFMKFSCSKLLNSALSATSSEDPASQLRYSSETSEKLKQLLEKMNVFKLSSNEKIEGLHGISQASRKKEEAEDVKKEEEVEEFEEMSPAKLNKNLELNLSLILSNEKNCYYKRSEFESVALDWEFLGWCFAQPIDTHKSKFGALSNVPAKTDVASTSTKEGVLSKIAENPTTSDAPAPAYHDRRRDSFDTSSEEDEGGDVSDDERSL